MRLHSFRVLGLLAEMTSDRIRAADRELPPREVLLCRLQEAAKRQAKCERELAAAASWFGGARLASAAAEQASADAVAALANEWIANHPDSQAAVLPGAQPVPEREPSADAAAQREPQAGDAG
jgi:hypothetical protein